MTHAPTWVPLTPTQRVFWTALQLYPDRPVDRSCFRIKWCIDLDLAVFEQALQTLVASTDALQLVIMEKAGVSGQTTDPTLGAELQIADFAMHPDPTSAALSWLDKTGRGPLDLHKRSFTTSLARCGDGVWIWQLAQHHFASDYSSNRLLVERLSHIYQYIIDHGTAPTLYYPSYLEFLAHPNAPSPTSAPPSVKPISKSPPEAATDICPVLERNRHRSLSGSTGMLRHDLLLDQAWISKARAALDLPRTGKNALFHKRLFDHFLTATVALTARLSGSKTVHLGMPNHNRYSPESAEICGLLMRLLPLRFDVEKTRPLKELHDSARAVARASLKAARRGEAPADLPYAVSLNYLVQDLPKFGASDSVEMPQTRVADSVGLDLGVRVRISRDETPIQVSFDVNEQVAAAMPHADISAAFLQCLNASLHHPQTPLDRLSLVDAQGHARAEKEAAEAHEQPRPAFGNFVEGFLAQAAQTPDAVAIRQGDAQMSYRALERETRTVAESLMHRGIGAGARVAITLPRSDALLIAMLGVLRAGGSFCIIDPTWPARRNTANLHILDPDLIITKDAAAGAPIGVGCEGSAPVLPLATLQKSVGAPPARLPRIGDDWPMYVMFSSGSTDAPKGIVIPHGGFAHYLNWALATAGHGVAWDWALASTAAFELGYRPLATLLSGGTIHVYQEVTGNSFHSLFQALDEDQADFISLTPTHLRQVLRRGYHGRKLKAVVVIGEKLSTALAQQAQDTFGAQVSVQNWYGPTEAVMASTMHRFEPAQDIGSDAPLGSTVPIGRAAPCSYVQIRDPHGALLPRGMLGELHIGGAKMSLGYLDNLALNAAAFTRDPHMPHRFMFRTGDIGWRNGKGDLFFSHRAGQNQKFKGEWLELTSVAQAVSHHPDVSQAAALLTSDDAPELICYYVAQQPISAQELRKTAAQYIGRNALPDRFFALDALPQTPSGKCDLKALAARPMAQKTAQATPASHAGAVTGDADATKTEQRLTAIWKHALNLEQLTRFDDFFDLGGDSLSIVRMLLDVEEAFHIRIPHARLPRVSTIAQLAVLIAELKKQAPALKRDTAKTQTQANPAHDAKMHDTPALEDLCRNVLFAANRWGGTQVGQSLPIRAFHETGKKPPIIWCFNDTFEPARMAQELGPDQPLYALRSLNGILESRDKKRALASRIAARYADEIQTLSLKGPLFIGGNCQAGAIAENLARLFLTRGADLAMLALLEHTPTVAYPAKLALFYGATSRAYNPFLTMEAPEIMWEHMHNDVVWDIISGDHGEYFTPAHLPEFIKKLKRRMEACDALTSL